MKKIYRTEIWKNNNLVVQTLWGGRLAWKYYVYGIWGYKTRNYIRSIPRVFVSSNYGISIYDYNIGK